MKLASLRRGGRDGTLIVVDRDVKRAAVAPKLAGAAGAPTLQAALDRWDEARPILQDTYERLNAGGIATAFPLRPSELAAPLPRAYQFLDASAYLHHVELVRRSRGDELPASLEQDPLMYQGGSDCMLGPCDPIVGFSEEWGIDFESEVAIVTDDVPLGATAEAAADHIQLWMLINDVSLRGLIPAELAKGFGFVHGKPSSACSPVAVTSDELGSALRGGKLHLPLVTTLNSRVVGRPDAGVDMAFDFPRLVSHAAKTRRLGAGTIIGSGTVSNRDRERGSSCLLERRTLEHLETGVATTPYLRRGDRVRIEMFDANGRSVFGAIDQRVESP
ncbi:MAG: fumarylacetoacetate hydrolase family protein [Myxococcales bacterium]|nr:fumarylacetoacetate hydrolase family protein [Myxococcales bacterium]